MMHHLSKGTLEKPVVDWCKVKSIRPEFREQTGNALKSLASGIGRYIGTQMLQWLRYLEFGRAIL